NLRGHARTRLVAATFIDSHVTLVDVTNIDLCRSIFVVYEYADIDGAPFDRTHEMPNEEFEQRSPNVRCCTFNLAQLPEEVFNVPRIGCRHRRTVGQCL